MRLNAQTTEPELGAQRPPRRELPGAVMDLHMAPLDGPLRLDQGNMLHGLVTALTGASHLPDRARFTLRPSTSATSGWSVYVPEDSIATAMAADRRIVDLGKRTVVAELGPARRVEVPDFPWAWSTVRIRTITPMVLRKTNVDRESGSKSKVFRRDFGNLLSTLLTGTPQRCGVAVWATESRFGCEVLAEECRVRPVRLRGKVGRVQGLQGWVVARVCPGTRWLLAACQTIGIGGRVGYGFGSVAVEAIG